RTGHSASGNETTLPVNSALTSGLPCCTVFCGSAATGVAWFALYTYVVMSEPRTSEPARVMLSSTQNITPFFGFGVSVTRGASMSTRGARSRAQYETRSLYTAPHCGHRFRLPDCGSTGGGVRIL